MSHIVMKLNSFDSIDNNYNVNEQKLNIENNSQAQTKFKEVANIKYNLAQRMNNYNLSEKESVYEQAIGGVYGGSFGGKHIYQIHNNDLNSTQNAAQFKNLINEHQKDNPAFARLVVSQKTWEDFYGNYLNTKGDKVVIDKQQVHKDLKTSCEQYHKQIYINKYNKQNKLVDDKKINLQTYNLEAKIKTVGYDAKNFNFYFAQHTNTDNPHFHIIVWDPTLKNKNDYVVYKNDLFELKKSFDHKMYRQTKWQQLNEYVTRKNYLEFEHNVEAKNNLALLDCALKNEWTNFRYQYLKPEQKKIIDKHFTQSYNDNKQYQKMINNLKIYYSEEFKLKSKDNKKKNIYVANKVEEFLKPYKQKMLNDIKNMITKRNTKLLNENIKDLQIKVSKFVNIDSFLHKVFNHEYQKDNISNIENYLIVSKWNLQTVQKILLYYLAKNKVEDKELFKQIYNKYKVQNLYTNDVFEIIKNTKLITIPESQKFLNIYQKNQLQKQNVEKTINEMFFKLELLSSQENLDLYAKLDLKILLLKQLLANENFVSQKYDLQKKLKQSVEEKNNINWEDVNKNKLSISTFEIQRNVTNVFQFQNEFNKKLFLKSDIDKQIWTYVFKEEVNEKNLLSLRSYLINKNYNLNSIEYIEKTFLHQNKSKSNERVVQKLISKHKQFWKKDINEFIAQDKKLKDSFVNKNNLQLEIYLKNNNFDKQLCNWIIKDFNNQINGEEKMSKIESKNTDNFEAILTLNDALNVSIQTQSKILSYKNNSTFEFEKILNEFGKQTKIKLTEKIEQDKSTNIKLNKKFQKQPQNKQIIYPNFNAQKVLNEMKNKEEELIYNLSQQMWMHEQK